MKKLLLYLAMGLVLVFGVIQLIPVPRTTLPVTADIPTSPEVKAILKRACYDCHSNETVYPWYSHVAPVSWLVMQDIAEGRGELNFSTWDQYSLKERAKKIHESWETIAEGEMPLWYYTVLHPETRLLPADRQVLRTWARGSAQTRPDKSRQDENQNRRQAED